MSDPIDQLMQRMQPADRSDPRGGDLVTGVLQGIDASQRRRRQLRIEWALQVAALILALGVGALRGEAGAEAIIAMANGPALTSVASTLR